MSLRISLISFNIVTFRYLAYSVTEHVTNYLSFCLKFIILSNMFTHYRDYIELLMQ